MPLKFSTETEKSEFMGWMRFLADDLTEFSSAIGMLTVIYTRAKDQQLMLALNKNVHLWNTVFQSVQTTAIIVIGRIHDNGKKAYLKNIIKTLNGYKSMAPHADRFKAMNKRHDFLLDKSKSLRDNVFAHTSSISRYVNAFGFDGMTWDSFSSYWNDIASATESLERDVFAGRYSPMFHAHQLQDDMEKANAFFDAISASR